MYFTIVKMEWTRYLICTLMMMWLWCANGIAAESNNVSKEDDNETAGRYTIEGKVYAMDPPFSQPNWQTNTRIHLNGGEYLGFVRESGSFVVHNVPSGSYVLEVLNADYVYEPVRVEINSKGKFRARKVNHIQTSQVIQVTYPLKLKPLGRTKYFQLREQWRITDFLFNPMVLMMVLPLFLIMILPKMMNDPETKKDLEQIGSLTKFDVPEMSDMVTNFLAGGTTQAQQQNKKSIKAKKRQ